MQYHFPKEYNISNSYCHKEHHLRCIRWNHLEQDGSRNKLTQIKIHIGQYCVYNIISLQNITLQISSVTNSCIVDIRSVLQRKMIPLPVNMNRKIKKTHQIKFSVVTIKQQIKLVLQHSLYKKC